jgi:hypothetical protein
MGIDINRKNIPVGSVVYYIQNHSTIPNKPIIKFGIVEEHYASEIALKLYEIVDTRTINGIPIKELKTPSKWYKLPKGWSYDTKLIEYGTNFKERFPDYPKNPKDIKINEPDSILAAIDAGLLVPIDENDHCNIETEITKEGWRIVRNYSTYQSFNFGGYSNWVPSWISLYFHDVYSTYEEAKAVVDAKEAEFKRQSELSDYDWSVEQIDKSLNRAVTFGYITEEQSGNFMKRLLELKNVEDIETRVYDGGVQWKYWKNKRWKKLE